MDRYLGSISFVPFAVFWGGTVFICAFFLLEGQAESRREVTNDLVEQRRKRRRGHHQHIPEAGTDSVQLVKTAFL